MIKLLKKDISSVTESEYTETLSRLPAALRGHVEGKRIFADRVRSAVGYTLVLSEAQGEVLFSENGKPYFKDLPLYFSISHSENMVIAAISDKNIGADVEKICKPKRGVAKRFFTESELKCDFFEVWTKKEALGKCKDDMAFALKADTTKLSFYTEKDGEYLISVYEE